jgi:uncharacterized membrane protein
MFINNLLFITLVLCLVRYGLFSDNVAKEATARHQTTTKNKMHLMAFLGAVKHRVDDATLDAVHTELAKVYY